MRRLAGLGLCMLAVAPTRAAALQGGWNPQKFKELGLSFPMARDYEQIPTQPDEKWIVLYFAERIQKQGPRKSIRPELNFVWIDHVPDAPVAKLDAPAAAPEDGEEPAPDAAGGEAEAKKPAPPPINSIDRYLEQQMHGWSVQKPGPASTKDGWRKIEARLVWTEKKSRDARGWICTFENEKTTLALIGFCDEGELDDQSKIWSGVAAKLEIEEPEEKSVAALERIYANKEWLDVPYRIEVRSQLVRGWKAVDTPHYIVIFDTKDQPLIRLITSELEAMRKEYERLFPPKTPVTVVSTVRVCKDQAEYLQYGGPPRTGGYFNPELKELVFFDYENVNNKANTGKANSRIVLYHEAFHQYIHASCGELAPHYWFNEGNGDFFSGAKINGGKVANIGVNPWRIQYIKQALDYGKSLSWREIVEFGRKEFYSADQVGLCYAQGWSMIYFLRTSREVEKRPEWKKILPTYFGELQASWAREFGVLQATGKADDAKAREAAEETARGLALKRAFENVDYDEIEDAWKRFMSALEWREK